VNVKAEAVVATRTMGSKANSYHLKISSTISSLVQIFREEEGKELADRSSNNIDNNNIDSLVKRTMKILGRQLSANWDLYSFS
jgi:hypothetical protein